MRQARRLLIAIGAAVLILAALAFAVILSGYSLIILENRGDQPVALSVETHGVKQFAWSGEMSPGERVIRFARLSDNSFTAVCRNDVGIHRTTGGYVTHGWPHRVDIGVAGCEAMTIRADVLP